MAEDVVVPEEESICFKKPKKGPSKVSLIRKFAEQMAIEEEFKGESLFKEFLDRPTFDLQEMSHKHIGIEFAASIDYLYQRWQQHRDAGFPSTSFDHLELLAATWAAAKTDAAFQEVTEDIGEELAYWSWITGEDPSSIILPEGWPGWSPGLGLAQQLAYTMKRIGAVKKDEAISAMKPKKEPKAKKVEEPMDLRSVFERRLLDMDVASLSRPWMQTKALRLVTTAADLRQWAERVKSDVSMHRSCPKTGEIMPVVALDTENNEANGGASGLDTRIVNGLPQLMSAGICLSADGIEGLYVPLTHEDGNNADAKEVQEILQDLLDCSLVVFFNAKYDREVIRLSMPGFTFRPYPYFEDVQLLHFLLDPKSEVTEEVSSFESAGLKALAERELGIVQIELDEVTKVKIRVTVNGKKSYRTVLAPFNWVPTPIAVYYAAADAITTWLLWDKMHEEARKMKYVHRIDHELVDALAWVERMRPLIDVPTLKKTCKWHQEKLDLLRKKLSEMAEIEDFNPGSVDQLARVLFETYKFPMGKKSALTGKPSTDTSVIEDLQKKHPHHPFLDALVKFREYASLHPDHLAYEPRDYTARMYFKQCTVAGGRLAAMGGKFEKDGGFGMNPQAIKGVGGNRWVTARRLRLEDTEDLGLNFDPTKVVALEESALHPSCFKKGKRTVKDPNPAWIDPPPMPSDKGDMDNWMDAEGKEREADRLHQIAAHERAVEAMTKAGIPEFLEREEQFKKLIPEGIVNNHIARYCGEWWSLATDAPCTLADGTEIPLDPPKKVDSAEVINIRSLFIAPEGYTYFTVDYSNIEMRVAANVSGEPKFINEFLYGSGDFHTLTASNVFPEFNDPETSKARKKELRSLAKIINFALLYGGTEHSIYENMKVQDPTITKERAKAMVDRYWESVPKFYEWAESMKLIAKQQLTCKTKSGRRIDFRSAMRTMRITEPLPEHWTNYRTYWDLKHRAEVLLKASKKNQEKADLLLNTAQELMMDKASGVANLGDYKKFIGKVQRVAVNAPLQGLAGDFMRAALGAIHQWAMAIGLGDIFLLHSTVHDEIDFSVKNEYVPFVLPRVVRLMKLREMHKAMKWPVPIETDCEYGQSWDVKEHLTGDDSHAPAGWTKVPGLRRYVPAVFDKATVQALAVAVRSNDQEARAEVYAYLKEHTHKRCHVNIHTIKEDTPKLDAMFGSEAVDALVAILQLHEYWTIEEQDPHDPEEETLTNYQRRMGLEEGEIIQRPKATPVIEEAPVPLIEVIEPLEQASAPEEEPTPLEITGTPKMVDGYPVLRYLDNEEYSKFMVAMGVGRAKVTFYDEIAGGLFSLEQLMLTEIPLQFLVLEPVDA